MHSACTWSLSVNQYTGDFSFNYIQLSTFSLQCSKTLQESDNFVSALAIIFWNSSVVPRTPGMTQYQCIWSFCCPFPGYLDVSNQWLRTSFFLIVLKLPFSTTHQLSVRTSVFNWQIEKCYGMNISRILLSLLPWRNPKIHFHSVSSACSQTPLPSLFGTLQVQFPIANRFLLKTFNQSFWIHYSCLCAPLQVYRRPCNQLYTSKIYQPRRYQNKGECNRLNIQRVTFSPCSSAKVTDTSASSFRIPRICSYVLPQHHLQALSHLSRLWWHYFEMRLHWDGTLPKSQSPNNTFCNCLQRCVKKSKVHIHYQLAHRLKLHFIFLTLNNIVL